MKKKKMTLLLSGQLRTFDNFYVKKSWKKFFEMYDVDVYGCFWKNRGRSIYSVEQNLDDDLNYEEEIDLSEVKECFQTENILFFDYDVWLRREEVQNWMRLYGHDRKYFDPLFGGSFLREKVFDNFYKKFDTTSPIVSARPDLIFMSNPPEYFFDNSKLIWHQRHNFQSIIYSTFFSSNFENMQSICRMYSSKLFNESINLDSKIRYGNILEHCGVIFSFSKLSGIEEETYKGSLFAEPFRSEQDILNMRIYSDPKYNSALQVEDRNWFPFFEK